MPEQPTTPMSCVITEIASGIATLSASARRSQGTKKVPAAYPKLGNTILENSVTQISQNTSNIGCTGVCDMPWMLNL